ncbi:MAG: hypothetical protein GTO18_11455, partial [Anaerolineales bacterium]|nr:hypothetical protein [Anaerolineales bacterium]
GDLLLDTDGGLNHKILDSGKFGVTKGITKGDAADYGQVWYEINTLSLDKVTTHFILPEDGSKTYTTENGALRYVGEQRYYAVVMNIDNDHQEMVIIPESVFYDSELGDILLDEDLSDDDKKDKF